MAKQQILSVFQNLAMSQGFYGRMLEYIKENPDYLDFLEGMKFKDSIELIMYLEC